MTKLEDQFFWGSARVEIMRLLTTRWAQFSDACRLALEARIRQGVPRDFYRVDAFENDEKWRSVQDSSIYRRLKRIELAGGALTVESLQVLAEISARHPVWQPSAGDRDDFDSWSETRHGPSGQAELLAEVADEGLVKEAMRLQRERYFEQGDVWRVFCSADPERALRGLQLEAANGQWDPEAWRYLLWEANDKGNMPFQFALAELILKMPEASLRVLMRDATSWLQRRRETLSVSEQPSGPCFWQIWDRLADLAFAIQGEGIEVDIGDDLATESLNSAGGMLASCLLDALSTLTPHRNSGLGIEFVSRFDRIAVALGRPGLLARVRLVRSLEYLDAIDPVWVEANLQPRFAWDHPEALPLWRSFADDGTGSARLFNALKPAMLAAFERQEFSDDDFKGMITKLLSVAIWHQRGEAPEYDLSPAEVRRALTVGPASVRQHVSWNLWRIMGTVGNGNSDEEGADVAVSDKPTRWRTVIGPLFRDIWPLDARLRSKSATQNLVLMALECGEAFPESVAAILDVIVPYQLYQISHSLRLDDRHGQLVRQHPLAFLKLTNALIDPVAFPVPNDLAKLLDECVLIDATIARDPAYLRLNGLRRQRNA